MHTEHDPVRCDNCHLTIYNKIPDSCAQFDATGDFCAPLTHADIFGIKPVNHPTLNKEGEVNDNKPH